MFKNFLTTLAAWSFEILGFIVNHLPPPWRSAAARAVGGTFARFSRKMKAGLEENLVSFFGMSIEESHQMSRRVFRNFSETLYDFFYPDGIILDIDDKERLEKLRESHGGIMFLTFHLGHWELGARTLRQWNWPVTAVYQPYRNKKFKQVIEKRRAAGVHFIPVGGRAAAGVREALRRGHAVAMLGDHPFGEEGTVVNLLGHKVIWPKGPVLLAVRAEAPIVIAVMVRTGRRRYRALVGEPLFPEGKTRAEVNRLSQEVATKFGKLVAQYPDQWYRFRPFEFVN